MDEKKRKKDIHMQTYIRKRFGDIRSLSYKTSNDQAQMRVPTTTSHWSLII
jgi:hypothetical protein